MKSIVEMQSVILSEKLSEYAKKICNQQKTPSIIHGFKINDNVSCNIDPIKIWAEIKNPTTQIFFDVYFFLEDEKDINNQGTRARYMVQITPALQSVVVYKLTQIYGV